MDACPGSLEWKLTSRAFRGARISSDGWLGLAGSGTRRSPLSCCRLSCIWRTDNRIYPCFLALWSFAGIQWDQLSRIHRTLAVRETSPWSYRMSNFNSHIFGTLSYYKVALRTDRLLLSYHVLKSICARPLTIIALAIYRNQFVCIWVSYALYWVRCASRRAWTWGTLMNPAVHSHWTNGQHDLQSSSDQKVW